MRRLALQGPWLYALAYFVILELMIAAGVLYWPYFEDNTEGLRNLLPIPVLKTLVGELERAGVVGYVVGQQFFKGCNTLGTAAAALFAAGAVAGEVHRGTLEIWLARPFSRLRILSSRYAAGALATTIPVFLSSATIPWFADRVGEDMDVVPLLWCSAYQSLFLLAIYSVTFLFSTLGSNPTRIALAVLFFTTFEFALYMVGEVTHWSLYRLSDLDDYIKTYEQSALDPSLSGMLAAVSLVAFTASVVAFRRRVP